MANRPLTGFLSSEPNGFRPTYTCTDLYALHLKLRSSLPQVVTKSIPYSS